MLTDCCNVGGHGGWSILALSDGHLLYWLSEVSVRAGDGGGFGGRSPMQRHCTGISAG